MHGAYRADLGMRIKVRRGAKSVLFRDIKHQGKLIYLRRQV